MNAPKRQLTARFTALVSHYLFEPCFARPGEGHDKGGVESRGKNIRLQHLTPIPHGQTLGEISSALLASLDQDASQKRDREGRSVQDRFEQEKGQMQAAARVVLRAAQDGAVQQQSACPDEDRRSLVLGAEPLEEPLGDGLCGMRGDRDPLHGRNDHPCAPAG